MPKNPVFDLARGKATPALVESLFSSPGAYWDGDEYWTLDPRRGDSSIGSFSINGHTGLCFDFAGDGCDLITLIADSGRAASKVKAAEMIVAAIGGVLPDGVAAPAPSHLDKPAKPKPARVEAVIPIPEDKLPLLEPRVRGEWAREKHGEAKKSWVWRRPDRTIWCATVRFERYGQKDVLPHFFGVDGKWHEGNPMDSGRPLFHADQIAEAPAGTKVLLVEGESCGSVQVPGWLVVTWIGGTGQWEKTDWAPLERFAAAGDLLMWPDADHQNDKAGNLKPWNEQPGQKTALGIQRRLPGMKILDVRAKALVKSGWDIGDAVREGVDPVAFIASCPLIGGGGGSTPPKPKGRPDDSTPFLCLGYDKGGYYFMRKDRRTVFSIGMGAFTSSKLGELASLSAWQVLGPFVGDQGTIKPAVAQDYLIDMQQQVGFYDPKRIRGAGVWRDHDGIVLNTGDRILTQKGEQRSYDAYTSTYYYVPSLVAFGEMHGPLSTVEDGQQLDALFRALEFEDASQAVMLMGWALLAPFGGVLTWRPHVWLTGQKGTGKTWAMDHIVVPLCGPFALLGSGSDTVPGIRWALDQDARPMIVAEAEPKDQRSREKIKAILELARNSSDDGSGNINISQPGGGTKSFHIRSMFCFSSKVIPPEDDAVTSRISRIELKRPRDEQAEKAKKNRCLGLLAGLLDDPGRYTRRIFRALPQIIADIEYLRANFLGVLRSQRAADQVAPMLAAAWAVQSDVSIREAGKWLEDIMLDLSQESKVVTADEDTFLSMLVARTLRTDGNKDRTIAELLESVADEQDKDDAAISLLERYGITLRRKYKANPWILYIATESAQIAGLFRDTQFGDAYGQQVRRSTLIIGGPPKPIKLNSGRVRCQGLDWPAFRDRYMGEENDEEPPF